MSFLFQTFDKSLNFGESGKSWISNPFSTENFETKIQPSAYDVYVVIKKEKKKGCGFFSPFFEKIGEHVQNSQFCWKYYAPVKIILRITDACIVIAQLQNAMKIQSFNILKPSPIRIPAIPYYIPCALRIGG